QPVHAAGVELVGIELEQSRRQLDAQLRRVKGITVEQHDIHSAQAFALVLVRARRKVFRHEAHTLDTAGVQICGKLLLFDPGSADHLKRRIGPPPDRYVRALDQTYARI